MAVIKPFQAIRPCVSLAAKVAALPYDVMDSEEARKETRNNPYSFLHVDKAEIDLDPSIDLYDIRVYEKASQNLKKMIEQGTLIQDKEEMFYIYRLIMEERVQTGLVVCTSIDEYLDGTIKKHELTREEKEQDRIRHVDSCNANTGPIFLAYKGKKEINTIITQWTENHVPVYDFVSEDEVRQIVWVVDETAVIENLIESFAKISHLYIADGHHRNASAVKVGLKRRQEKPDYTGKEEFNYYLSVLFDSNELKIMDYNRLVKDLNGNTVSEFLQKVKEKFIVSPYEGKDCCYPQKPHQFGLYLEKKWYLLEAKSEIIKKDVISSLDVSILQEEILIPILGIGDLRTDKRIDFVGGIRGLKELEKRVDSGEMKLAFSMYPTSIEELINVADQNKIMPPKSTWFEPKLRSGLFIHSLEN